MAVETSGAAGPLRRDRIRRFGGSEITFHWVQAFSYLVLASTGAALLADGIARALGYESEILAPLGIERHSLARVHLGAGLAAIALLFVVALGGNVRAHLRNVGRALRIMLVDIRWIGGSLVRLIRPSASPPEAGFFNPGQKLNLIHTITILPLLAATGLGMASFAREVLAVWIAHVILFALSVSAVAGHLWMALVNRETRASLPGMLIGCVPIAYARHHHRRWLREVAPEHAAETDALPARRARIAWGRIAAALVVAAALVMARILWGDVVWVWAKPLRDRIAEEPLLFLKPASLTRDHERDPKCRRCASCHDLLRGVPDAKCESCHARITERRAGQVGYHGAIAGGCRACHPEHRGEAADIAGLDAVAFNHARARFPLLGAHAVLPCERCHGRFQPPPGETPRRYIGLAHAQCVDCHDDPHGGTLGACERCHSERAWKGRDLLFAHDRDSRFPLDGAHTVTPCEKCHVPPEGKTLAAARFRGWGRGCAECHDDPHGGTLGEACARCHRTTRWAGAELAFDHGRDALYPLDAAHRALACGACHREPELARPKAYRIARERWSCGGCHADIALAMAGGNAPDGAPASPHVEVACHRCHDLSAPHESASVHAARCTTCHNASYAGLYRDWEERFDALAERALRAGVPREAIDAPRRIGQHHPGPSEKRLRALAEGGL